NGYHAQPIPTTPPQQSAAAPAKTNGSSAPNGQQPFPGGHYQHNGFTYREPVQPPKQSANGGSQPQPAAVLAARDGRAAVLIAADRMAAAMAQSIGLWDQAVKTAAEIGLRLTPAACDI